MQTSLPQIIRLTAVFAVIGLAVAGCGRKGDLDPPSVRQRRVATGQADERRPKRATSPSFLDPLL
jgi:predicted small lipoprotein YifL